MKKEYAAPEMLLKRYHQEAIASASQEMENPKDNEGGLPF